MEAAVTVATPTQSCNHIICRHCQHERRGIDRRGLCRICYRNPHIRRHYGKMPTVEGLGSGNAKLPMPSTPTDARPGSEDKIKVLEQRALAGEQLWHPKDRTAR